MRHGVSTASESGRFTEFIREILAGAARVNRLEALGRIDPAIVKYLGADRMPPSMHTIPGDGRISVEETKMLHDLRTIARLLDGEVSGSQVLAPGPGHGRRDRSLSVRLSPTAPDGVLAFSHARDDWRVCRDYVRERLGLPRGEC